MKLILKDGEIDIEIDVLKENFGFFEPFDNLIVVDNTLDMSHLPITVNSVNQLISLGKIGDSSNDDETLHKLLFDASIDNVLYKSLLDASICLDTNQIITQMIEHSHMFNRFSMYRECPDFYKATMLEVDIRRRIAKGNKSPFYGVVEITREVCKNTVYTPINPSCSLLFSEIDKKTRKYKPGDCVMQYRYVECDIVKQILSLGNVVISGGYALEHVASHKPEANDIDIFVWGLTEKQATEKLHAIGMIVGGHPYITGNAYTYIDNRFENNLSVQVILRLYNTPSEIVHGFDIQASKVFLAMDKCVIKCYGTPSFITTMKYNAVWVDTERERQSSTYALRMLKYFTKGFSVVLTGYDRKIVRTKSNFDLVHVVLPQEDVIGFTCNHRHYLETKAKMVSQKGLSLLLYMEYMVNYMVTFWYNCSEPSRQNLFIVVKRMCDCCIIRNTEHNLKTSDYMDSVCYRRNLHKFLTNGHKANYEYSIGWRLVTSSDIPQVTWTTRDPGSFHPEQENFYQAVYCFTSFTPSVAHQAI
jgi:hypothetical protein